MVPEKRRSEKVSADMDLAANQNLSPGLKRDFCSLVTARRTALAATMLR